MVCEDAVQFDARNVFLYPFYDSSVPSRESACILLCVLLFVILFDSLFLLLNSHSM